MKGPRSEDESTRNLPQSDVPPHGNLMPYGQLGVKPLLVTIAGENGQPGILGKSRISQRQIAKNKGGPTRRFDLARMNTVATKSGLGILAAGMCDGRHGLRISQLHLAKRKAQRDRRAAVRLAGCSCDRHSGARVLYETHKPARQFMNPFRLTQLNGVFGDQLASFSSATAFR